jgi:hypothetical protein
MSSAQDNIGSSLRIAYSNCPEITAVELPFFATSTKAAFSTLGGEEITKNLVRDGAEGMLLKFPSSNALQGSLAGKKTTTGGGLLVRIRRKKQKKIPDGDGNNDGNNVNDNGSSSCRINGNNNSDNNSNNNSNDQQPTTITEVLGRVDNIYVFQEPADYQVPYVLRYILLL